MSSLKTSPAYAPLLSISPEDEEAFIRRLEKMTKMTARISTLHTRIAEALGWTEAEVKSVSFQSLRDIVRPVDQKLANELAEAIRTGSYLVK